MSTWKTILKRSEDINRRRRHNSSQGEDSIVLREIEERLAQVADLTAAFPDSQESVEWKDRPLEHSPLSTAKILFHLDRCEQLLKELEEPVPGMAGKNTDQNVLLYPSLGETILSRIFSLLVYLRARVCRYDAEYQAPTVREILYLRSPWWLEPLMRRLLPRKRLKWSYYPKADAPDD